MPAKGMVENFGVAYEARRCSVVSNFYQEHEKTNQSFYWNVDFGQLCICPVQHQRNDFRKK
jgi:hypothetical protein